MKLLCGRQFAPIAHELFTSRLRLCIDTLHILSRDVIIINLDNALRRNMCNRGIIMRFGINTGSIINSNAVSEQPKVNGAFLRFGFSLEIIFSFCNNLENVLSLFGITEILRQGGLDHILLRLVILPVITGSIIEYRNQLNSLFIINIIDIVIKLSNQVVFKQSWEVLFKLSKKCIIKLLERHFTLNISAGQKQSVIGFFLIKQNFIIICKFDAARLIITKQTENKLSGNILTVAHTVNKAV